MVSTTHAARFLALPGFYEFFFVFYEPLATFSPVFFYFIWPGKYALYDMPRLELLPSTTFLDSRAEMALYQMVNCHFLVVLFVSFVFQAARKNLADNPRAQESVVGAVLFALAIVDITHLLGMHFAVVPEQNRLSPQAWGSTIWISDSMVLLDFFVRNMGRGYVFDSYLLTNMKPIFDKHRIFTSFIVAFVLAVTRHAQGAQQPLQSSPSYLNAPLGPPQGQEASGFQLSAWSFNVEPSPNATDNYVFETVAGLLQQWPNTRYRHGHTLVPVAVPAGTLLYHGTRRPDIPRTPEWVALDPEFSYVFCVANLTKACWHLTMAVKKPLNLLYFDGASAAKMQGPLDVQDILVWGKVIPERTMDEYSRIYDLCRWGEKYGLDGFLRMSMDFEIMLCNFTKSADVVSFLNIETELIEELTPLRPSPGEIWLPVFRGLEAGHWHNFFPGDSRVKLDLSRLISFYDTDLFPSLTVARHGQERWEHRVEKLGEDREGRGHLLNRLDEVLGQDPPLSGSGIDWSALTRVIVHRFADRLELLRYTLNGTVSTGDPKALKDAHAYIASMLAPYIIDGVRPPPPFPPNITWATPVFKHCAETHTKFISTTFLQQLTPSERLILRSVNGVVHEICRVIVKIWAEGVELGIEAKQFQGVPRVDWELRVGKLMQWLDWSVWVKCTPQCGFEETCWLPTWPGWAWTMHDNGGMPNPEDDYWRRPQPACMRRVAPYKMV